MWLFAFIGVASAFSQLDFHQRYISQFVRVSEIQNNLRAGELNCPRYECSNESLSEGQCVKYQDGFYLLQQCPEKQFCATALYTRSDAYCVDIPPAPEKLDLNPGEACTADSDCHSQKCGPNKKCVGRRTGESCDDQSDCDVGFACHNLYQAATCQPQRKVGDSCDNYLTSQFCINAAACNNKSCEALLSRNNGAIVDTMSAAALCKSGYYEVIPSHTDKAICMNAPKSPNQPLPIKCDPGDWCRSSDGEWAVRCRCGFSSEGQGYCPLFPGDDLYQAFINSMFLYIEAKDLQPCHMLDVGQLNCGASDEVFKNMLNSRRKVDFFHLIPGNDKCVKEIYTYEYWDNL